MGIRVFRGQGGGFRVGDFLGVAKRGYCHRLGSIGNDPGARSWHANVLGWFRVKGFGFRGLGCSVS